MWDLVDRVAMGQVLFENFSFIVPVTITQMLQTHLSSADGALGPFEAAVPRDSVSPHS
jgi:hypothetical protein